MEYKISLTLQELQIIGQGLLEVPGKYCNPLLDKIEKQVKEQLPKEGEVKTENGNSTASSI